jgi:hypothetical protein
MIRLGRPSHLQQKSNRLRHKPSRPRHKPSRQLRKFNLLSCRERRNRLSSRLNRQHSLLRDSVETALMRRAKIRCKRLLQVDRRGLILLPIQLVLLAPLA